MERPVKWSLKNFTCAEVASCAAWALMSASWLRVSWAFVEVRK
jgi:hypothetical protein